MPEDDATRLARRKLLKHGAFIVPAILSTVTVSARAAQATCAPGGGPCSPNGGCNPSNPCNPQGGTCNPDTPCAPVTGTCGPKNK